MEDKFFMEINIKSIRIRKTKCAMNPYIATLKGFGEYGWGSSRLLAKSKLVLQLFDHGHECLCDKVKCCYFNAKHTALCCKGDSSEQAYLCMSNEYKFYKAAQDVRQ
jgi:hypothetical protein